MSYPNLTYAELLDNATREELEALIALFQGYLDVEHNERGRHTDITAHSVTLTKDAATGTTGDATIGGDLEVAGRTTLGDGSGLTDPPTLAGSLSMSGKLDIAANGFTSSTPAIRVGHPEFGLTYYDSDGSATTPQGLILMGATLAGLCVNDSGHVLPGRNGGAVDLGQATGSLYWGDAHVSDVFQHGRSEAIGAWAAVPFNAANFTADTGTWTVDAGDVGLNRRMRVGKTLFWKLEITASDVSAAGAFLRATLPDGATLGATFTSELVRVSDAGAAIAVGLCIGTSGNTYVEFRSNIGGSGFSSTSGDNTSVQANLTLEVQ